MNDNQTQEKKDILKNLGAELKLVPAKPYKDDNNFVKVAARLADELRPTNNNGVIWANQFDNTANAKGHYEGTGKEIWDQTEGKVDGFVCSSGTGGTISGVGKFLKEKNPNIKVWGIDTYGSVFKKYHETGIFDKNEIYPYITEGIGEDILPKNVNFDIIDGFVKVTDEDAARYARLLAKKGGIFAGYSCGAAIKGLELLNKNFNTDDVVVVLLHDSGSRYIGKVYNDDWIEKNGFKLD